MKKCKKLIVLMLLAFLICLTTACKDANVSKDKDDDSSETKSSKVKSADEDDEDDEDYEADEDDEDEDDKDAPSKKSDDDDETDYGANSAIEDKIMNRDSMPITDEDFEVLYKGITINKDTEVEYIIDKLGLPEDYFDNNEGYISGNANYRRWLLWYPNYIEPEIRMIILSKREYEDDEVKDGDSYIVGIYIIEGSTNRGIEIGDSLDEVLQRYGKPDSLDRDSEELDSSYTLRYSKDGSHINFILDNDMTNVNSIFIDYNMERSIEEQFSE